MNEIKVTQTDGKIHNALGLEESILPKWLYSQISLQIQCNPYLITSGISYRNRTKKIKFGWKHKRPQIAIMKKKKNPEKAILKNKNGAGGIRIPE